MEELKIISLFSGYGTQELALKYSGIKYRNVANCDILKSANEAYDSLHTTEEGNLGDVSKVDEKTFPHCDFLTYSFPCFTENTLVLTNTGYKKINQINIGDKVITHNNSYKEVLNKFDQGKKEIWEVVSSSVDKIETTENHKFYVKTKNKNGFSDPYWKDCYQLTSDDYLGIAINQNNIIPEWKGIQFNWKDGRKTRYKNELSKFMNNKDFWWIIGRYIGDGWTRSQGGIIIICCSLTNELLDITSKLDNINIKYNLSKERTTYKIHIARKEFSEFVLQFGRGAHNKRLTNTIIDLPINLLKSFIEGYHSADGNIYKNSNRYRISSVSKELIYGVAQCIAKAYSIPYSIYKSNKPEKYIIEGRVINQRSVYLVVYDFTKNKKNSFYDSEYIWSPVKSVKNTKQFENVWDIEVEEDHSFTANGCIVHNCQDISISGVQRGIERGTRSGLLYEVERIVEHNKPKYLLMENVKNLVSKNHIKKFNDYIEKLNSLGYGSAWMVLNGADFGCPQNRERVFMFSVLGESSLEVSNKMMGVHNHKKTKVPMRTFVETNVDNSLFITPPYEINTPKLSSVCKLAARRSDVKYDQARRIYSIDGCSPCLTTSGSPQIMLDDKRIRTLTAREGYRFMGVKDSDIDNLLTTSLSTKQHVALAGNSICVPVMQAIFEQFFTDYMN
jgi:site-specific DNA-cytosine methylase/intein/homing endonuclease